MKVIHCRRRSQARDSGQANGQRKCELVSVSANDFIFDISLPLFTSYSSNELGAAQPLDPLRNRDGTPGSWHSRTPAPAPHGCARTTIYCNAQRSSPCRRLSDRRRPRATPRNGRCLGNNHGRQRTGRLRPQALQNGPRPRVAPTPACAAGYKFTTPANGMAKNAAHRYSGRGRRRTSLRQNGPCGKRSAPENGG